VLATLAQSLSVAVAVVLCGVVFRGRSRDPMALLFTLTMLLFSALGSRTLLTYGDVPVLRHAFTVAGWGTFVCLALVFVLFPDGRVVPRWGRWLPPGMVGLLVVFPDAISLADRLVQGATDTSPRTYVALLGVGAVLTLGAVAQVHRYRYVSSTVERQQAKWVTGPLAVLLTFVLVGITVPLVLPGTGERWLGWMLVAVLFHRLRSRVREAVDRRFNRPGYEAKRAVDTFVHELRDELDLATICRGIERTATVMVQLASSTVWLLNADPAGLTIRGARHHPSARRSSGGGGGR
jgi:hypothetical protein